MKRLSVFAGFFTILFSLLPSAFAQDEAIESINNMSLWELILSVEWILIPLTLLSIAAIALIIFNFFWLKSDNICSKAFEESASIALKNRSLESLIDACRDHDSEACARVLLKTISFAKANPSIGLVGLKEVAETEASRLAGKISQPSTLLMDLGVLGPLVGLLGTVIGILKSFGNLASDATPMKTMLLAGGVSQALVATAMGLSIGLLAMGFYAFFRQKVISLVGFFESILTEFVVRTIECLGNGKNPQPTPSEGPAVKAAAKPSSGKKNG
ncbi:MAG: MotA/TolQ/ExbB proton channel family protein [Verrucomicrobiota bacterium]